MSLHSAIIVSDLFHMRRVSMIFKKVFKDTPVSLAFSPADDGEFLLGGLWSPGEIRYILSEYVKIFIILFDISLAFQVDERKGHDMVIRAMTQLTKRFLDVV